MTSNAATAGGLTKNNNEKDEKNKQNHEKKEEKKVEEKKKEEAKAENDENGESPPMASLYARVLRPSASHVIRFQSDNKKKGDELLITC